MNSQLGTEQSTLYGDVKSSYGGAGGWDGRGCATWAPRSATRQGEEQHRHTERGSHTRRDKGGHTRQGGGAQQGGRGNWNSGNREPEWSGWQSVRMGGSDNKGDGLASQPRRYRVPGQPLLNRHQVGGVSRSPNGLFAQQEWEPIRGRPTVRGKRTYGGRPGQRVEEQGTWAAQKHSEAGYGRPVDRGVWTAKTVKRPRQQPAHPQYANYWAPLTRKRHTVPHSAQSQHANYWAPRTRKRHQQEHRPQRPTESSDPTQHAKGRTGDRPGPRKGATTRRNVTQGGGVAVLVTPLLLLRHAFTRGRLMPVSLSRFGGSARGSVIAAAWAVPFCGTADCRNRLRWFGVGAATATRTVPPRGRARGDGPRATFTSQGMTPDASCCLLCVVHLPAPRGRCIASPPNAHQLNGGPKPPMPPRLPTPLRTLGSACPAHLGTGRGITATTPRTAPTPHPPPST